MPPKSILTSAESPLVSLTVRSLLSKATSRANGSAGKILAPRKVNAAALEGRFKDKGRRATILIDFGKIAYESNGNIIARLNE